MQLYRNFSGESTIFMDLDKNFEEIFEVSTKEEVIISFLSVLEMVKKDEILLTQDGNFKNIVISLKEGE